MAVAIWNPNTFAFANRVIDALLPRSFREKAIGASFKEYVLKLCKGRDVALSKKIEMFKESTIEKVKNNEDPFAVLSDIRNCFSEIKIYLSNNGGPKYKKKRIEEKHKARRDNDLFEEDYILEAVFHEVIVEPLIKHLYQLLVRHYLHSGVLAVMAKNMQKTRNRTLQQLGASDKVSTPTKESMSKLFEKLERMRSASNIFRKRDFFLEFVEGIAKSVVTPNGKTIVLGADDVLPVFEWLLANSGMVSIVIEANLICELLPPSHTQYGKGGYYLTMLSSAIKAIKRAEIGSPLANREGLTEKMTLPYDDELLVIAIADESKGLIYKETLRTPHGIPTKQICGKLAEKYRIRCPKKFGLYKMTEEKEMVLVDSSRYINQGESVLIFTRKDSASSIFHQTPLPEITPVADINDVSATDTHLGPFGESFELLQLDPLTQRLSGDQDIQTPIKDVYELLNCVTPVSSAAHSSLSSLSSVPSEK
ncbi:Hypothetical predicted protein [Cloeon dipterum]|uniref:VPS9 domain-containing protein n=1 Tax=Cloeon dipterum TaxID=197152 RepID=A0A8S1CCI7_9INSE|nr:Hypothetical predicted protein [Cloeon dipterum]